MMLKATKIQAWWRGTLVRRALLHAALRVWIIQCWWRKIMMTLQEEKQKAALLLYIQKIRAIVKLQSYIRMWLVRQQYSRLCTAVRITQDYWRNHAHPAPGFFQGSYELRENQLKLHLDISMGSHICRITDCIPFPIKN
uniref:Uncharacterized protein n=1 Tax=Urocitellus parryii TaxID=9999 RepID=A0A8D2II13_UROPR